MIYATAIYNGEEQLFCIDRDGERAFPLSYFLDDEKVINNSPITMLDFISLYEDIWTDKIAYFYGRRPKLSIKLSEINLSAPVPAPARNLVCLGKNYEAHARELKDQKFSDKPPEYPIYFTKPDHTVIGTEAAILLHDTVTGKVDYEVELAVIIGKKGINIPKEKAEDYIFGYTVANDVSARDLQHNHTQWFKGKSLTTHCPIGPWIVHKSVLPLPLDMEIKSYVNGELRQSANVKDLIFDIPTIISDLSRGYELRPGDIILTGTPAGVGMAFNPPKFLKHGDEVVCQIEKIGTLRNTAE